MTDPVLGTKIEEPLATAPTPITIPPVTVTVIGNDTTVPSGTVIPTPGNLPNIIQNVVTPLAAIVVRFLNSYLTTLVGLLGIGVTTTALPASDFAHLLLKCMALSLSGPAIGLLKDLITIFGKLEQKYPLATGSI